MSITESQLSQLLLTDAEKYQRKKQQDAARQQKYYAANKVKIAEKRKADRELCKRLKAMTLDQVPQAAWVAAPAPAAEPRKTRRGKKQQQQQEHQITQERILEFIDTSDAKKDTKKTTKNNIKQIFRITGCADMKDCLNMPDKLIDEIETGKKKNGANYSTNSIKGMFQTVVTIMDTYPGLRELIPDGIQKQYRDRFQYYKDKSADERDKNQIEVPLWKDYLKAIWVKFGEYSKEYLVARIYHEMPVRDDLQLKIVKTVRGASNPDTNYIIIPSDPRAHVEAINNVYKTSKTYGTLQYKFSPELSKLVRAFVKPQSKYLFPEESLSKFVATASKEAGMGVTINTMRKMTETEAKHLSFDERRDLAKRLGHSPQTALASYVGTSVESK